LPAIQNGEILSMLTTMTRAALIGAATLFATASLPALAQDAAAAVPAATAEALTDADIARMRAELRADKKKVTAETLKLTEAEAAKFWPIYDKYIAELTVINKTKYDLIKEYSERFGSFTDAQATDLTKRWLQVDIDAAKLRSRYVPIVGKVLPGVKTATFFQIDRRLAMLINLGLASELPIMQLQSQAMPAK
jgi:hypothetical protein